MPAPAYSRRLFCDQGVDVPTTAFAVPSGLVFVVRSIDVYVGAPDFATQLLFKDGITSAAWLSFAVEIGESRSFTWTGRQVFEADDYLVLDPSGHAWDIRISGYELAAAPATGP